GGRQRPGLQLPDCPSGHRRRRRPGAGAGGDPRRAGHRLPAGVRQTRGAGMSATPRTSVRNTLEERALSVLRPLIIVGLLLAAVFPFYYMVLLSFRPLNNLLDDPGALWVPLSEVDLGTYRDVLAPADSGGQGFLTFIRNSMLVAFGTVVLTLLVAVPGAYAVSRLKF